MSVRPSVTRRYFVETAKHFIKVFFSPLGSQTIVVSSYQMGWQYFDGDGASNAGGRMEKTRFSTNIWLYLGNDAK